MYRQFLHTHSDWIIIIWKKGKPNWFISSDDSNLIGLFVFIKTSLFQKYDYY